MDPLDLTTEEYDEYLDWRDSVAGRDSEGDDANALVDKPNEYILCMECQESHHQDEEHTCKEEE